MDLINTKTIYYVISPHTFNKWHVKDIRAYFSRQMVAIVFIILQIFFTTPAVLKIGEYHSDIPQFELGYIQSRGTFRPITREQKYFLDYNVKYFNLFHALFSY